MIGFFALIIMWNYSDGVHFYNLCLVIRFLFKQRQPKRFNYKPLYYDETKEYIEARKAQIKAEGSARLSHGHLSRQWRANQRRCSNIKSNKTFLVVLALLLTIAYLVFYR